MPQLYSTGVNSYLVPQEEQGNPLVISGTLGFGHDEIYSPCLQTNIIMIDIKYTSQ